MQFLCEYSKEPMRDTVTNHCHMVTCGLAVSSAAGQEYIGSIWEDVVVLHGIHFCWSLRATTVSDTLHTSELSVR